MKMRNVHEFDGKIPMKLNYLYTEKEMKKIINEAGFLKDMRNDAQYMTTQILMENNEKNIDDRNHKMDARQMFVALLDRISHLKDEEDKTLFHQLLEEQLSDMKNLGPCPQGRTIRLWQLLQSLE
jgi:hypothetical protein